LNVSGRSAASARKVHDTAPPEIRIRAERRLGEMIIEQKATVGLATGGQPYQSTSANTEPVENRPTLADIGVDKKLSSHSENLELSPTGNSARLSERRLFLCAGCYPGAKWGGVSVKIKSKSLKLW